MDLSDEIELLSYNEYIANARVVNDVKKSV